LSLLFKMTLLKEVIQEDSGLVGITEKDERVELTAPQEIGVIVTAFHHVFHGNPSSTLTRRARKSEDLFYQPGEVEVHALEEVKVLPFITYCRRGDSLE